MDKLEEPLFCCHIILYNLSYFLSRGKQNCAEVVLRQTLTWPLHSPAGLWLPWLTWNHSRGWQHLPRSGISFGPNRFVESQTTGDIDVAAQRGGKLDVLGLCFVN